MKSFFQEKFSSRKDQRCRQILCWQKLEGWWAFLPGIQFVNTIQFQCIFYQCTPQFTKLSQKQKPGEKRTCSSAAHLFSSVLIVCSSVISWYWVCSTSRLTSRLLHHSTLPIIQQQQHSFIGTLWWIQSTLFHSCHITESPGLWNLCRKEANIDNFIFLFSLTSFWRTLELFTKWSRIFIESSEFSEFMESDKSLKHDLG